jgi:hypothetical protein
MVPSNLQGLNIVHPVQPHNSSVSDSQDLLSTPPYPDLTAQLDLWTNLSFESDEPLIHNDNEKYLNREKLPSKSDDDDDEDLNPREGAAAHDGHENVVTGTTITTANNNGNGAGMHMPDASNFDLNQFLSGFGIDPFTMPNSQLSLPPGMPSLAQLLSLHSQPAGAGFQLPPPSMLPRQQQNDPSLPAPKRHRSRKASVSTVESPDVSYDSSFPDPDPNTTTPVTPAEDKRRRNTAASARFRMKKKEREAALEKKAKELEVRVNELERECEGLRRENGWLKGLVVGVTGAQPPSTGKKRSREELEAGSVSALAH